MQTITKLDKTLANLVCSGRCTPEEAPNYRQKLEELAKEVIDERLIETRSKVFKALGDETRLKIIALLRRREMCVCELMAALNLTQGTASHHLMILENAGIVKDRKDRKWVFYSISESAYIENVLLSKP
jgi:DNA-binding transcriptional ArsR family regulator